MKRSTSSKEKELAGHKVYYDKKTSLEPLAQV